MESNAMNTDQTTHKDKTNLTFVYVKQSLIATRLTHHVQITCKL